MHHSLSTYFGIANSISSIMTLLLLNALTKTEELTSQILVVIDHTHEQLSKLFVRLRREDSVTLTI